MEEVKLIGAWPSPFSYRVIWALKLKGIPFEYIEEDLSNKSHLLLQYNPVHKQIPVLVHSGKPICESMVILEYIEEMWPQNPLLPIEPYQRSMAKFWAKFADDKGPVLWTLFRSSTREEQEKAKQAFMEMLGTVEEYGLGEKKFFGGEEISLVDIAFGGVAHWVGVVEDVVGVKLLSTDMFPRLHAWIEIFKKVPEIKDNLPDRNEMFAFFKHQREMLESSSS